MSPQETPSFPNKDTKAWRFVLLKVKCSSVPASAGAWLLGGRVQKWAVMLIFSFPEAPSAGPLGGSAGLPAPSQGQEFPPLLTSLVTQLGAQAHGSGVSSALVRFLQKTRNASQRRGNSVLSGHQTVVRAYPSDPSPGGRKLGLHPLPSHPDGRRLPPGGWIPRPPSAPSFSSCPDTG